MGAITMMLSCLGLRAKYRGRGEPSAKVQKAVRGADSLVG